MAQVHAPDYVPCLVPLPVLLGAAMTDHPSTLDIYLAALRVRHPIQVDSQTPEGQYYADVAYRLSRRAEGMPLTVEDFYNHHA